MRKRKWRARHDDSDTARHDALPSWVPRQGWKRRELVIWGAHGGAGTTTLATRLQPAWDMGAVCPEPDPRYPADVATGSPGSATLVPVRPDRPRPGLHPDR